MAYNREQEQHDLQRMYRSLKAEEGNVSLNRFVEKFGQNQRPRLGKAFGGGYWGKLVESCGDTARTFSTQAASLEKIIDDYGSLTRELGRPAVSADWGFKELKPTVGGMYDGPHKIRFGQLPQLFLEHRGGHTEWADVCALIRSKTAPNKMCPRQLLYWVLEGMRSLRPCSNLYELGRPQSVFVPRRDTKRICVAIWNGKVAEFVANGATVRSTCC
jgi:hypothetical protein